MVYTRNKLGSMVLGMILNDLGEYGFVSKYRNSLCKELFTDRQHAFVYGIIERMSDDCLMSFSPKDVFDYAERNNIKYGNVSKFCLFMCELATENYDPQNFRKNLKELVKLYIIRTKIHV